MQGDPEMRVVAYKVNLKTCKLRSSGSNDAPPNVPIVKRIKLDALLRLNNVGIHYAYWDSGLYNWREDKSDHSIAFTGRRNLTYNAFIYWRLRISIK